jgi:hypothetical protein
MGSCCDICGMLRYIINADTNGGHGECPSEVHRRVSPTSSHVLVDVASTIVGSVQIFFGTP